MAVRRTRKKQPKPLTAGHIVAISLKRARELRGLSQAEAGELLGEHLRRPWSAATVSAAERSWEREPARSFTANELDGFSRAFGLPLLWFLLHHRLLRRRAMLYRMPTSLPLKQPPATPIRSK